MDLNARININFARVDVILLQTSALHVQGSPVSIV